MMTQSKTTSDFNSIIANFTQKIQQATVRINNPKIPRELETPIERTPKWVDWKHIRDAGGYC